MTDTALELCGRFADLSNASLAAQCRMQAREALDPEYTQFMNAVADRLASTTPADVRDELASYEKFDGIGPHAETIETRARIGERYLEAYESALSDPRLAGYTPADCPSELLLDILNGSALSLPAAPDGWRPIETAPKDGTPIDLWVVFPDRSYRWADARWMEAGEHNCSGPGNWCSRDKFPLHSLVEKPVATHWMPIPAAPKEQG